MKWLNDVKSPDRPFCNSNLGTHMTLSNNISCIAICFVFFLDGEPIHMCAYERIHGIQQRLCEDGRFIELVILYFWCWASRDKITNAPTFDCSFLRGALCLRSRDVDLCGSILTTEWQLGQWLFTAIWNLQPGKY